MASFEFLAIILTGLGLTASIVYYTFTLQNTNKTRQTQLFMQLYQNKFQEEGMKRFWKILGLTFDNFDEYMENYGFFTKPENDILPLISSELGFYDGLGVLLKKKMIDVETVYDIMGYRTILTWFKLEVVVKGLRGLGDKGAGADYGGSFEYLANEMIRIRQSKGIGLPFHYLTKSSTLHQELNR